MKMKLMEFKKMLFVFAGSWLDRMGNKSRNDSNDVTLYVAASHFEKVQIWKIRKTKVHKQMCSSWRWGEISVQLGLKKTAVDIVIYLGSDSSIIAVASLDAKPSTNLFTSMR